MTLTTRRVRGEHDWKFTASFRLGKHWQEAGDYVRAHAAYVEARKLQKAHRPTLYNLAVVQVRLGLHESAWETLDALSVAEKLPKGPDAKGDWRPSQYPIAYQRALILDYLERPAEASDWSEPLAERSLDERGPETLRLPALVLHAGIVIERDRVTHVPEETARRLTRDEASAADPREPTKPSHVHDPAAIFAFARRHAAADTRTHYNLACFLSRLAELVPDREDSLAPLAVHEAGIALQDANLASWARSDPSLGAVHRRPEWEDLVERSAPVPDAPAPDTPVATAAPAAPPPQEVRVAPVVRDEREQVVDRAVEVLEDVHAGTSSERAIAALEHLREHLATRDERAYLIDLAAAVAEAGDPGTVYWLPDGAQAQAMELPFRLEEVADEHGSARYYVAESTGGPPVGAEVTHWNGLPMERAVQLRAECIAGATRESRRARGLLTLTHRPAGLLAPFQEGDVRVRLRGETSREVTVGWEPALMTEPEGEETRWWSLDPVVDAVARMRGATKAMRFRDLETDAGRPVRQLRVESFRSDLEVLSRVLSDSLARPGRPPGLLVDLRGNPGGSTEAAAGLLSMLGGEPLAWRFSGRRKFAPPSLEPSPYAGVPKLVLIDALTGGAAANFALAFARLELGPVVSTARHPGLLGGLTRIVATPPARFSVRYAALEDVDESLPGLHVLPRVDDTGPGRDRAVLRAAASFLPRGG